MNILWGVPPDEPDDYGDEEADWYEFTATWSAYIPAPELITGGGWSYTEYPDDFRSELLHLLI